MLLVKRRCCFTHQILDRNLLFRVVKSNDAKISIDLSYKAEGRGAYILRDEEVINKAKKKDSLSKALRIKVDPSIYDELINLVKGA